MWRLLVRFPSHMTPTKRDIIVNSIREAFAARSLPAIVIESEECLDCEIADVEKALDLNWNVATAKELDQIAGFIFWLTPEAFCWFLPRITIHSLELDTPTLLIVSSIIGVFGSPTRDDEKLDGFLGPRLRILTAAEKRALKDWFEYLLEIPELESPEGYHLCHAVDLLSAFPN
jgi:hypothetical protein